MSIVPIHENSNSITCNLLVIWMGIVKSDVKYVGKPLIKTSCPPLGSVQKEGYKSLLLVLNHMPLRIAPISSVDIMTV